MEKLRFKNWKIGIKLLVSFLVLVLLFFIVTMHSYRALTDINNNKIPLLNANEKVNESMLLMRKQEKDFLLRERVNETFFETGKSDYLDSFEDNYNILTSNVSVLLKSNDIAEDEQMKKELNDILSEAKIYHDTFLIVAEKTKERGYKDYGLEGELRTAIHTIEDTLMEKDDIIFMLEARRSEKDYFLRHDMQYVDKLTTIVTEFKDSLQSSNDLEKITLLEEYFTKFQSVVAVEQEIGLTEDEGLNGVYRDSIHKLEPFIADIHKNIINLINDNANNMIYFMMVLSFADLIIAVFFALFVSRLITKPINAVNVMLKDIAQGEGDLTKQIHISSKDEIGTLSNWFNKFTDKIKNIIKLVQTDADTIALFSKNLTDATEQANSKIEQIAHQMTIISDGIQNNSGIIEEATAGIEELANGAFIVSKESEIATNNSKQALDAAKDGAHKLGGVKESINQIELSSDETYRMMEELKETSLKINEIASIITGISEQTNLLALNANIEAARAGEHGKGFAVVAGEVKILAERSKSSADNISKLILGVENKINETYITMQKEKEYILEGVDKVNKTDSQFQNILDLIEHTTQIITVISKAAKTQSDVSKEMSTAMSEISNTTQESASSSNSINQSIQEQVSAFEEIGTGIDELSNIANELQAQTKRFKTDN